MRRGFLSLVFVLFCSVAAALSFPELSGRVVDDAHILSPRSVERLDQALAAYEQESTNQIVVATVPSLQGAEIEDYGYQLGRHWGLGQKGKDNGAILLVAPNERRVRIEVGYGLEGVLTDAQSHEIVQDIILPDFRQGQMEKGVVAGTYAVISALGGTVDPGMRVSHAQSRASNNPIGLLVIVFWIVIIVLRIFILPWWFPLFLPRGGSGFGGGGGFGSGGGFSGGGGSFGGGGASGGW